jgi:hypothetical protein
MAWHRNSAEPGHMQCVHWLADFLTTSITSPNRLATVCTSEAGVRRATIDGDGQGMCILGDVLSPEAGIRRGRLADAAW